MLESDWTNKNKIFTCWVLFRLIIVDISIIERFLSPSEVPSPLGNEPIIWLRVWAFTFPAVEAAAALIFEGLDWRGVEVPPWEIKEERFPIG